MARPLRIEYAGAFYHITSRGNERKDIFKNERDFERFLTYLETAVQRYKAVIHVYCLMSNHYHLLLETPMGNLSQIIRHINGAYTTYYNTKWQRAGHLFQGRYKAILVEADEYAGELSRYIHSGKGINRNLPALRELTKTSIEEIIREVEAALGKNGVLSKKASIYLCHRYSGRTLREIGRHFSIGESAVSQTSKRFSMLLDRDKKLNKKIKYICNKLKFV